MIARRSVLRAITNREIKIKGEYNLDQFCITVQDFQIYNINRQEYQTDMLVKEGDSVLITPSVLINVVGERNLIVKPAPILYANGLVSCLPVIDRTDGEHSLEIRFECHRDVDLSDVPYITKFLVTE